MLVVGGIHNHSAVGSIKLSFYAVHSLFSLFLACEAGNNGPGLGIEPHICFGVGSLTDNGSVLLIASYPSVLVPAVCKNNVKLSLYFVEILDIFGIVLFYCVGS